MDAQDTCGDDLEAAMLEHLDTFEAAYRELAESTFGSSELVEGLWQSYQTIAGHLYRQTLALAQLTA